MRFEGIIKTWNDDRGFGFVEPTQSGQEILCTSKPSKSWPAWSPTTRSASYFRSGTRTTRQKRATKVSIVQTRLSPVKGARVSNPAQWGGASLFAIPAFLVVLLVAHILGNPPGGAQRFTWASASSPSWLMPWTRAHQIGWLAHTGKYFAHAGPGWRLARCAGCSTGFAPQVSQG